jgi:hypothetical protein
VSGTETDMSPDGRFAVTYRLTEQMNGQWAATPTVRDLRSGAMIVALEDDCLDASVCWNEAPGGFSLAVRRWPGVTQGVSAHFDVDGGTVRLGDAGELRPLAEAASLIADHFAPQQAAAAPPAMPGTPTPSALRRLAEGAAITLFIAGGLAVATGWLG